MTPPPSVGYLLSKTCNFNHPSLPLWGNIVHGWPLSDNWLIKLALVLIMKYQIILHITVSIICALETRQLGYTLHLWCLGNLVCINITLKKYSHYPNPLTNLTISLKILFFTIKLTLPQIKILRKIIEVACFLPLWAQDVFVHASRTIKKILPDNQSGKTQVSGTAKVLLLLKKWSWFKWVALKSSWFVLVL